MFRRALTPGVLLILAAALFALTPTPGEAAGRGGGHGGGGGHFGGGGFHAGHVGVAHFGAYHGGSYRGSFSGRPYAHYGYHPYAHYGHRGYHRYYGGYGSGYPYVGSYYSYPYYGDSGLYYDPYSYGSYDAYPYASPDLTVGSLYDDVYADDTPPDTAGYLTVAPATGGPALAAAPAMPDDRAHLTVTVPAGARLRVDDTPTTATGPVREFQSPPLTPGRRYAYTVRASWDDNGHRVTRAQRVEFTAGDRLNVRFPAPTATTAQKPAATHG